MSFRFLFISNGHGEDLIAVTLAKTLLSSYPDVKVEGFPMVGLGKSYSHQQIPIVAPEVREFPSGGFIYNSSSNLGKDLFSGLIPFVLRQFQHIRKISSSYQGAIIVGDVVPLLLAYWGKMRFVFYGSAKSEYDNTSFLKFQPVYTPTERYILKSRYCRAATFRDELTADRMVRYLGSKSLYLGNPMMDISISNKLQIDKPFIALLPGSREDASLNLEDMLLATYEICQILPQYEYYAAITPALTDETIIQVGKAKGYFPEEKAQESQREGDLILVKEGCRVHFSRDSFGQIISQCQAVIGLAGTANEQAAGLGKPVVSFISRGIQYQKRFAASQHRILGDAVSVTHSPDAAAKRMVEILTNRNLYEHLSTIGQERMGAPGASKRLAELIMKKLCGTES